jgi:hypothetical protein
MSGPDGNSSAMQHILLQTSKDVFLLIARFCMTPSDRAAIRATGAKPRWSGAPTPEPVSTTVIW